MRSRLRSTTGCSPCKRRRKKCDEHRPICHACTRIKIQCVWNDNSQYPIEHRNVLGNALGLPSYELTEWTGLATADFVAIDSEIYPQISNLRTFIERSSTEDEEHSTLSALDMENLIVKGIATQWQSVHHRMHDLMFLDRHIKSCGHGIAARLAFVWLFYKMTEVQHHHNLTVYSY